MIAARCSNRCPRFVPCPAVCSSRMRTRPRAPLPQQRAQSVGDEPQPAFLSAGRERARMHDEPVEAERFGAIDLLAEGGERLRPQRRLGGGEVDQVAVVRDDRLNPRLVHPGAKARHLVGWQRPRPPLPHRLGEDLQRLAARRDRTIDGARQAAGNGQVGAEPRHQFQPRGFASDSRLARCRSLAHLLGSRRRRTRPP